MKDKGTCIIVFCHCGNIGRELDGFDPAPLFAQAQRRYIATECGENVNWKGKVGSRPKELSASVTAHLDAH